MTPLFLTIGDMTLAGMFDEPRGEPNGTSVLFVPPFGCEEEMTYRARKEWSDELSSRGFACLRIDLPGTGDSLEPTSASNLVENWVAAIVGAAAWLKEHGATRLAVIAIGVGGLLCVKAMKQGLAIDDLAIWGAPSRGRHFIREMRALASLGDQPETAGTSRSIWAGGYELGESAAAAIETIDLWPSLSRSNPQRLLIAGRDGVMPAGGSTATDIERHLSPTYVPGKGWSALVAGLPSRATDATFQQISDWLATAAQGTARVGAGQVRQSARLDLDSGAVNERTTILDIGGAKLAVTITSPARDSGCGCTVILFNSGQIRRSGPNRLWTSIARDLAGRGFPVIRADVGGIGDSEGDSRALHDVLNFYDERLVDQARGIVDWANQSGLPSTIIGIGLCSGGYWALRAAMVDERITQVVAANPRMLALDDAVEGRRELGKMASGHPRDLLRRMWLADQKMARLIAIGRLLFRKLRTGRARSSPLAQAYAKMLTMAARGQNIVFAFTGDEPLHDELEAGGFLSAAREHPFSLHRLPSASHTLRTPDSQRAFRDLVDSIVDPPPTVQAPGVSREAVR